MIYVSSSCIKEKKIADVIHRLSECGIRNIELSGGTDYYEDIECDLKTLKDTLNLQYACHAYFPPPRIPFVVNLASCNDKIYQQSIEHYEQCINLLRRLDCQVLSIHAGFLIEIGTKELGSRINSRIVYDEDKSYDRFCCAYEHIAKLCVKSNIKFYLENNVLSLENYNQFDHHNYLMMTDYASIMKMRSQLNFNLLLDLAHLHVSANTLKLDYADECEKLKEYVQWIHVSENNGIVDEHKPLTKNSAIVKSINEMYRPGMDITLETTGNTQEICASVELVNHIICSKGK